jgi:hypothetical protein
VALVRVAPRPSIPRHLVPPRPISIMRRAGLLTASWPAPSAPHPSLPRDQTPDAILSRRDPLTPVNEAWLPRATRRFHRSLEPR